MLVAGNFFWQHFCNLKLESIMITATKIGTRGIVQIKRQAEGWLASVTFYGDSRRSTQVVLDTKRTIELFRAVGAPLPVSKKDVHVVEFFNCDPSEVEQFGFQYVSGDQKAQFIW
ncbi:MAG: hypothetical protein DKT66_16485 [Candidatus Melainabacteria bacterium]|nr:MAG: hypothetical protein DKT66_16485 [Candidatus Melainabacteria bacterium]